MSKLFQKKRRRLGPPVKKAPADLVFDYKDTKTLSRYILENGAIGGKEKTGLAHKQQRLLTREIKRARHLGMLPFTQTL
jgi:small subunit ribosomal protein S18